MPMKELIVFFPEKIAQSIIKHGNSLKEIRIRADRPIQFVCMDSSYFIDTAMSVQEIRDIALRMMGHSYYSCEHELSQGFFTMANGCRVGIGGTFVPSGKDAQILQSIGSLCIRIARAVPGCATPLIQQMTSGGSLRSTLILSKPGFGKTTILRDAAQLLSEMGYIVGIADERCEIAACRNGIPTMDVGISTDIVDGCPKAQAMEHLIRSMAPQVIITDEIGNESDLHAIREASRKGAILMASAHAESFEDFESSSLGILLKDGSFQLAALLSGNPGNISAFRSYRKENF